MAGESDESSFQSYSPKNDSHSISLQFHLDTLRKMVRKYIDKHLHQSAVFWADKVATLSNEEPHDIYWLAQSLFYSRQFHRAALCIKTRNLHLTDLNCRYLAAQCHFAGKEYKEALDVLMIDPNKINTILKPKDIMPLKPDDEIISAMALLKGQIYEAMDNRGLAAECFRKALQHDVFCYDAFNSLIQHQMLSKDEETALLSSLPYDKKCPDEEMELAKFLYETQLKKYDKPNDLVIPPQISSLKNNLDIATVQAERCYYNCDYEQCYNITSSVLAKDAYHTSCLPIHISCLMELNKSNALFYLAHKLVDLYPESAVAWFAVGCYYLQINKTDSARRFLSKATTLDRVFGPAWLMYGHSFAVENEHDQAMAAYCRASQLMKGCHLPLLYIGLEYGLSNNRKLAERFFTQALSIAPEDPFVLHELGMVSFQNEDYAGALEHYENALNKVQTSEQTVLPAKWEPLLNNLGHTCRKLKKYEEALNYHEYALTLVPQNASTFSAIGFVHSLLGNWAEAVEYFHKALGIQRDDVFSNNMLTSVMEQLVKESHAFDDFPDKLPDYESQLDISSQESGAEDVIPTDTISDHTHHTSVLMDVEMEGAD